MLQYCHSPGPTSGWFFPQFWETVDSMYCVNISLQGTIMLFQKKQNRDFCVLCSRYKGKQGCGHFGQAGSIPENEVEILNAKEQSVQLQDQFESFIISNDTYEINLKHRKNIYERVMNLNEYLILNFSSDQELTIFPKEETCRACHQQLNSKQNYKEGYFVGSLLLEAKLMFKECLNNECSQFKKVVSYDGKQESIVNWKNKLLLPLEVIQDYINHYCSSGEAAAAWWRNKLQFSSTILSKNYENKEYLRSGLTEATVSVIERNSDIFLNFGCCKNPKVISLDGVVISTDVHRVPTFCKPWQTGEKHPLNLNRDQRRFNQVLATDSAQYSILVRLLNGKNDVTLEELHTASDSCSDIAVVLALNLYNFEKWRNENIVELCVDAKLYVDCILKTISPAVKIVPYNILPIIKEFCEKKWKIEKHKLLKLHTFSPVLFCLQRSVKQISKFRSAVGKIFFKVLRKLYDVVVSTFNNSLPTYKNISKEEQEQIERELYTENVALPIAEVWKTGVFFPKHKICRQVHHETGSSEKLLQCQKHPKVSKGLGPGILIFYCAEHSQIIGFVYLDSAESPRIVYETIVTRFPIIPQVIIYDNGCNTFEYCMNRNPLLFQETQFFTDGFHHNAHRNCAPTFDAKLYTEFLQSKNHFENSINTSLFEQKNSRLSVLKNNSPKMRFRVLVASLIAAMSKLNDHEQAKLVKQKEKNNLN